MVIRLDLDTEDARTLLEALTIYLAGFRREVAGTQNPDALERLVEDLLQQRAA